MWLFVMDGHIKPSEFFIKILQHYQMYTPAFVGDSEFSYKRPFVQAMIDIMLPWEHATTNANYEVALRQRGRRLGVTSCRSR